MGFTYGLAVVLVIFEGIIIQCEGAPKRMQLTPNNDIEGENPFLPNELIEEIVSKTDFRTIHEAIRSYIVPGNSIVMSRLLQDRIINIIPGFIDNITERYLDDDIYLIFGNYRKLELFFQKFGNQVKKIEIDLDEGSDMQNELIIQNIFKTYAKNFEELRILAANDVGFWEKISDAENGITFPEVKKFQFEGRSTRAELKLNLIFPKLECVTLIGDLADVNCLENVNGLKELTLHTDSIEEDQLDHIFANNKNITKISFSMPNSMETMDSIAKHLTNLKTLEVETPGENFLYRMNNNTVRILSSVTHFHIFFDEIAEVFGIDDLELSFDMPNLKKLTLDGVQTDDRIINFIQHFEALEILELLVEEYDGVDCIEKLKHIKEFKTDLYGNDFASVKRIFERFDEQSKLQTLKLVKFDESLYETFEETMKEINIQLRNSMKPTWTLSHEKPIGTREEYLMFKRDP